MGMDLYCVNPRNEDYEHLHFNWFRWGLLADLLTELNCDLTHMVGSNDGHVIPDENCQQWAQAIRSNLDRIVRVEYPDDTIYGGYRPEFHVEGTDNPVLISSSELSRSVVAQILGNDKADNPQSNPGNREQDQTPKVTPVRDDPEELEWLTRIADFLDNCGGAEQY